VISMSVEPDSSADRDKLIEVLTMLTRENPTFRYNFNPETGQTIINGMGELHLEVLVKRIRRDHNVNVRVGKPQVSYRETITASAEAEDEFRQQLGGRGQYAKIRLRVEPSHPEPGQENIQVADQIRPDAIKKEYLKVAETAARDAACSGELAGYPMINVKVTLLDGQQHDVDSSEAAFEAATRRACDKAIKLAQPVLMEPIMKVQVVAPDVYCGSLNGDLSRRRGIVNDSILRHDQRVINALVPLKEMFGYATDLRSLTQGRGTWTMEPSHYAVAPRQLADSILSFA